MFYFPDVSTNVARHEKPVGSLCRLTLDKVAINDDPRCFNRDALSTIRLLQLHGLPQSSFSPEEH
ncbi:hypothetical protein PanWU01x14_010760 [Parasponia andersonii]|uniref:Uncharacterized protein n=1 Tax=Parasponia andersonii TaxID=3476 RepID=A0A2P5E2R7_PARAD|nr:hypothetical protein PanWU01x14_010760 [Parasponia andersonii]